MGVREQMNKSPALMGAVGGLVLLGAIAAIWFQSQGPSLAAGTSFYTDDEGLTYFNDDPALLVPFERNGKQVVRAFVFQCGKDKPFVGFMERLPPDQKTVLEKVAARKQSDPPPSPQDLAILMQPKEIRVPGTPEWKRETEMAAVMRVMQKPCPDGSQPARLSE